MKALFLAAAATAIATAFAVPALAHAGPVTTPMPDLLVERTPVATSALFLEINPVLAAAMEAPGPADRLPGRGTWPVDAIGVGIGSSPFDAYGGYSCLGW